MIVGYGSAPKHPPVFHMDATGGINHRAPFQYVYFVFDGECIKIGHSGNPKSRLSQLQTSNSKKLRILALLCTNPFDMSDVENAIQRRFSKHRGKGEWFRIPIDPIDGMYEFWDFITDTYEYAPWWHKVV